MHPCLPWAPTFWCCHMDSLDTLTRKASSRLPIRLCSDCCPRLSSRVRSQYYSCPRRGLAEAFRPHPLCGWCPSCCSRLVCEEQRANGVDEREAIVHHHILCFSTAIFWTQQRLGCLTTSVADFHQSHCQDRSRLSCTHQASPVESSLCWVFLLGTLVHPGECLVLLGCGCREQLLESFNPPPSPTLVQPTPFGILCN